MPSDTPSDNDRFPKANIEVQTHMDVYVGLEGVQTHMDVYVGLEGVQTIMDVYVGWLRTRHGPIRQAQTYASELQQEISGVGGIGVSH